MARQDDIRLTGTSYAVLGLVRLLGRATPYDLKRLIGQSIENFWPVPHTSFYAEATRLAAAGHLIEEQEPGGRRRKEYQLTERGRAALETWVADDQLDPPQLRDEAILKVFLGADLFAVFTRRADWHRVKLGELEGYLEEVSGAIEAAESLPGGDALPAGEGAGPDLTAMRGARASLIAGVAYHRMNIEMIERELDRAAGTAKAP